MLEPAVLLRLGFPGSCAEDAQEMKDQPRNDEQQVADDDEHQPQQAIEDLSLVHLPRARNY